MPCSNVSVLSSWVRVTSPYYCDVSYEHPVVVPQVMHFKHVPFRTMVN